MKLKTKLALIILFVVCIYAAADWSIQKYIVLPSFQQLEHREALNNVQRVTNAFEREVKVLDDLCHDWAAWDDTYDFVQTGDLDYIESNLLEETFSGSSLNLIMIYDKNGNRIAGKTYNLAEETFFDFADFPSTGLPKGHPLINHTEEDKAIAGIILTSLGPMLISSRPILTSENLGPRRGVLIMGWFLDSTRVTQLIEQIFITFKIEPISIENNSETEKRILLDLKKTGSPILIEQSTSLMYAYTTFPDPLGEPTLLIRADLPREIHSQGIKAVKNSLLSIILAGSIIIITLTLLIHFLITKPIIRMTEHISAVKDSENLTPIQLVESEDEITTLGQEFNALLKQLEAKNIKQEQDAREHEKLIAELEAALLKVKTLSGMLPICSSCKKIRDDQGYWQQIEFYIKAHSQAEFSHSLCPDCVSHLYPDLELNLDSRKN